MVDCCEKTINVGRFLVFNGFGRFGFNFFPNMQDPLVSALGHIFKILSPLVSSPSPKF
jgi:hypothetical protein